MKFTVAPSLVVTSLPVTNNIQFTRKKFQVDDVIVPYSTSVWAAKSSAELIGVAIRFTVLTAAKFAVYNEIKINVKNHQTLPTILPAVDLRRKTKIRCLIPSIQIIHVPAVTLV